MIFFMHVSMNSEYLEEASNYGNQKFIIKMRLIYEDFLSYIGPELGKDVVTNKKTKKR